MKYYHEEIVLLSVKGHSRRDGGSPYLSVWSMISNGEEFYKVKEMVLYYR